MSDHGKVDGRGRGGHQVGQEQQGTTAVILPLSRPSRICRDCGIPFVARHTWYRRCAQCHRWAVIGISIARVKRLLGGAR
jgi:hypothetical protein